MPGGFSTPEAHSIRGTAGTVSVPAGLGTRACAHGIVGTVSVPAGLGTYTRAHGVGGSFLALRMAKGIKRENQSFCTKPLVSYVSILCLESPRNCHFV